MQTQLMVNVKIHSIATTAVPAPATDPSPTTTASMHKAIIFSVVTDQV
jgi:hypothetical protein